jgi:hypothetical protein
MTRDVGEITPSCIPLTCFVITRSSSGLRRASSSHAPSRRRLLCL